MAFGFDNESRTNYGTMGSSNPSIVPNVRIAGSQVSPIELNNLTENITTNIYTINSSWKNLENSLKLIGTARDNQGLRDKVHVTQLSCNQIVSQTTKDLHRLSVLVRTGNKQQKLQVEKLTNDFKEAVQCYSKFQKQVADKMKVRTLTLRQSNTQSINEDEDAELIQKQEYVAAQKSLQQELEFEQGMLVEREQRIQLIEGDILDINQIMRELGAMIHEQGEAVNSIENNIENVHGNVELGAQELQKAAEYQNKFRRKLCFLVALAVVVGIISAVILWTQLKK